MKLSFIAQSLNLPLNHEDKTIHHLVIDSRKVSQGDVFVAFDGEHRDGHDFIDDAIKKGAVGVIYTNQAKKGSSDKAAFFKVKDCTQSLAKIAHDWRKQLNVQLVGITGSCGKTTLKGLVANICQRHKKTLATKENLNNELGLPLTLCQLTQEHEIGILEMGAGKSKDIEYLCKIAEPNVTVINNIYPAHIEKFGSLQAIAATKGDIYSCLPNDGIAVLNYDSAFADFFRNKIAGRKTISFSLKDIRSDVYAKNIRFMQNCMQFELVLNKQNVLINLPLLGEHNVANALAAASVAHALDIPIATIQQGLEDFGGVSARLMSTKGLHGATIFDDSYNANPGSVAAALNVLKEQDGSKILVLGDMAELGKNAADHHIDMGIMARECGINKVFVVGEFKNHVKKGFGENALCFDNKDALAQELIKHLNESVTVLVKGSRSSKMEDVLQQITNKDT